MAALQLQPRGKRGKDSQCEIMPSSPILSAKQHARLDELRRKGGLMQPLVLIVASCLVLAPLLLLAGSTRSHHRPNGRNGSKAVGDVEPAATWTSMPSSYSGEGWGTARNAPPVAGTLGGLHDVMAGLQSGYNCSVAEPGYMESYIVCKYQYMAIWNGSVIFFNADPTVRPPPVNIDWMLGAILGIDFMPGIEALGLPPETEVLLMEQAVLTFFTFGHNFYHVFAEYMPTTHNVICQYLGLCTYDASSQLQVIMVDPFDVHGDRWAQPVSPDLSKCVSAAPVRHLKSPQWDGKLLLVRNVLAGWGPEARADHSHIHHWEDRRPPPRHVMELWRKRLADCLGFDASRVAPRDPVKVVIIDREYGGGRTFLNVADMAALVRRRWPQAVVQVRYLEGLSLEESARLFSDATVVVWQHGAAMANLVFLPHGASGVQVIMKDRPQELYGWPDELVRDNTNGFSMVHFANMDPGKIMMRAGHARWSREWGQQLTTRQKLDVWELKRCPGNESDWELNHTCEEFWMKLGASLEVDVEQLERALNLIMPKYFESHPLGRAANHSAEHASSASGLP